MNIYRMKGMSLPIESLQEELKILTNQINILIKTISILEEKIDKYRSFTEDCNNIPML